MREILLAQLTMYRKLDGMMCSLAGIFDAGVIATVADLNIFDDQRTSANGQATFEITVRQLACTDDLKTAGV